MTRSAQRPLLLGLLAVLAGLLTLLPGPGAAQGQSETSDSLQVSVSASATVVPVGDPVYLRADISNAPSGRPSYAWQMGGDGNWFTAGTEATFSYLTSAHETTSFRVIVRYGSGESATSDPITITFGSAPAAPTGPSVSSVAVTSTPGADSTYGLGETIQVTLTFSEAVDVTGTPRLKIKMDPNYGEKWASYASGTGTTGLTFSHEVVEPNISTQGIAVLANTLQLNGGTIRSSSGTDAALAHDGLAHDSDHKVDWQVQRQQQSQAENSPATGAPTITGTAQVGATLTAATSGISDADGLTNATFTYQWRAGDADISGATGSTYTLASGDQGKTITVQVSFSDDAGNEESLTSAATAAVAAKPNSPATGAPTITGTVQVGETLTASTSGISDDDGLTNATFSYQWQAGGADISGATGSTYTLVSDDEGETITVQVSFTDDAGNSESVTSAATAAVAAKANSAAAGAPTITGTVQVGETLTASTSGISDDDGLTNATFTYQWQAGGTDISGATGSTYTLVADDEGETVTVQVSFTDDAGNSESVTSAATAAVGPKPNSPATGAPTITGTVRVGGTLTASTSGISDDDGLDNATFTYQWLAGDADISGATGSTYTLVSADQGKTVTVQVGFTDDAGHEESLTSAATAAVAAAAPPSVTGVAVTSTPSANSTYGSGQTIRVTLTFSEAVDVTGTPRLKIKMDPNYGEKWAAYEGGSGTAQLVFAHTVVEPNVSTQGIAVLTNTLALNGGTIRSGSVNATLAHAGIDHDASHKVDWRVGAPSVTGVAVTSAPGADSTYALDETIRVTVTFDGAVDVTGTPRLKIKMDPNYGEKWAGYESGSGTTGLVFTHTVVEPNISTQGIAVLANTLELNGGTIASASANAALSHDGLGHDADHKVDWQTEASVEKPGQPENLAITATDNALEVSATWDATAGATSYKLGWRPTDGSGLSGVATDITGTSATATVLKSGEWHFYLIACNTAGCGNPAVTTVEVVPARAQSRQRNVVGDQTAEVLVSNVGQTNSNLFSLATGSEAQGFTTGTHSAGYALSTIEVNFTTTAANSNIVVELATGLSSGSSTTNVVATLTNPSSFGTGNVTFTAPAGTTLKPSTQYWVVMTGSSGWVQATNTNGQTGATGWSISDTSLRRAADGTGNWSTSSHERKIRVNGYAIPPKVSNTGQTDQHTSAGDKMSFGRNNAQGFTTGSNPGGYTLTRVDFEISIVSGTTPTVAYSLEIRKPGSSGRPGGDLVGTMTNPSDFTGTVDSYTHDGLELEPNTEYFAVFNVTTTSTNVVLESTASDDEDSGAADGWSINDKRWAKTSTGTGWADEDEKDSALQIAVYATEKPQKLVRNTGQAVSSTTTFSGRDGTDFWHHAQGFTTGSNSDGYTLSEVDVRLSSVGSAATPRVRIFSSSGSSPNAGLYVLNNPSSFADGAVNTFTAPANATLSANTTYFVVVETTATAQDDNNRITLTLTSSASEDTDGLSGWSVADVRHTKEMDDTSWASTTGLRMMVALRGTVIDNTAPTALISVLDSTAKTAAITFDEDLKTDTPAVSQFALQDDSGADIASTNPSSVSISGTVVTATFGSIPTNAVKIKYTPSSADTDNPLQDASGNKVAAFSQTLSGSMVGNIGQTSDGSFGMPTHEWAQAFTTGSDSDGYTLTGIELDFDQVGTGDPSFTVQVCTGTNTNPANSCLGTLTHPSSLPADVNTFTAGSDGITLSADTTYYVVVDVAVSSGNAGFFVSTISSDSEDTGGLTGWGIANGGLTRTLAAGATWSADTKSLVMRLLGPVKAGTDTADPLPKVSNIDQAHGSDVYGFTGSQQRAQGFTTGANANGYTLNSVDVKFGNAATSGVVVRLATGPAAGNSNATFVATLTHPSDYSALNTTFTAPAGTTLKPNTTYYVVLSGTSNATVRLTASNNEDSGAATGWSVADAILTRSSGTANWAADSSGDAGMIRVYATERGPTLISNTGQTAGSGRIAVGHSTNAIWSHALSFTTGGSGVTLGEVDLRLASGGVGSGATPRVSIYSASGGNPGSSLYVLTNPSSFKASAVNTFTAPANSTLDANTTYFVVLETTATTLDNTNRIFVSYTASSAEDTGGKSGWSIGDGRRTRSGSGAWTSPTDGFLPLIALRATFDASADTTAPKVTNVVLHQGHIDVVFDEDLDTSSKPAHGQFEVSINAVDISNPNWQPTPTGVKFKTNAPNTIELDFGFNLGAATNTVNWLTYTKPTTNPLKDGAGNEVATFTYGQRTTTPSTPPGTPPSTPPGTPPSTPPGTPPTPPTSSPGRSEGIPRHVSSALSGGIYLTLTFSEDLVEVSQSSLLYAFGYGINGGPYTSPSAATMRGATVVLTLRDTVKATDTLRIHCCSGILRDEDGIRVPEFVSYLRPVPPENTGTWISGDKQISLTWSEPLQTVDEDSLKWAFSYRVKVDGEWSTYGPWKDPTGATLVGNKVVLTIPDSLSAMNTVNVLYNGGLLKDHDGLAAAGFSTFIYPDPPEHIGTEVTGDYEITLTYDEQLMDVELSTYYFIITLPGGNWSKPTNAEVDGDTVVLTTKHKVKGPWSVKLNVFGRQIKDLDGLPDPYDYVTYVWGGG